MYRVHEFAQMAGITVRAPHHYDRLGLLRPKRTGAGYRLYVDQDLARLEQIVALKFLGLPLKSIRILLDRDTLQLPEALRVRRTVLEEKRRRLDLAIGAIVNAEKLIQFGKPAGSSMPSPSAEFPACRFTCPESEPDPVRLPCKKTP